MKIYTRTGDSGETSLLSGGRVSKSSLRVCAYGDVDELNSALGVVLSFSLPEELSMVLVSAQSTLFVIGTELSDAMEISKIAKINTEDILRLENSIDAMQEKLPELRHFIMPGGTPVAAQLHLARTVCRRSERSCVELSQSESIDKLVIKYINRLSDWLFVAARYHNNLNGINEPKWPGQN